MWWSAGVVAESAAVRRKCSADAAGGAARLAWLVQLTSINGTGTLEEANRKL